MECKHERIKSVNCELFCMECGAKLPPDFLKAQEKPAEKPAAKRRAKK